MDRPTISRFPPGAEPYSVRAGDFILVSQDDFFCRAIHLGQRLRYRGADRKYAVWNHAALIVDELGSTIEAFSSGVKYGSLSKYQPVEYYHVDTKMADPDREQAVNFAESCLNAGYGWPTILSIGFSLLTGLRFSFGFDGEEICSGLVARALERGWFVFPRDASHMTPADLAKFFGVSV